jgi:hypothetical protein
MANCPACNAELHDDFGLVECGQCHTPLFVQMDGRVDNLAKGIPPATPPAPAKKSVPVVTIDSSDETKIEFEGFLDGGLTHMEPSGGFSGSTKHEQLFPEPVLKENLVSEPIFGAGAEAEAEAEAWPEAGVEAGVEAEAEDEALAGAGYPLHDQSGGDEVAGHAVIDALPEISPEDQFRALDDDSMFEGPPPPEVMKAPVDLADMSRLANSVDGNAMAGTLRYTLTVSGIDTAEIRGQFKELITDRKFLWDIDSLIRSIRGGTVRIENISAVKAYLLIHRLRGLPVRVGWEQNAIHQD